MTNFKITWTLLTPLSRTLRRTNGSSFDLCLHPCVNSSCQRLANATSMTVLRQCHGRPFGENHYNPYHIAELPENAKELEPPIRYYRDKRFDEPDWNMTKDQALALYAEQHPPDLFTDFEESHDPAEWAFVERLIAPTTIPHPPPHLNYPSPSGWVPPSPSLDLEWFVRRKKDHHFDINVDDHWKTKGRQDGGFKVTSLSGVEGDIEAFTRDAKQFLQSCMKPPQKWQKRKPMEIETRIVEPEALVQFKGIHDKQLTRFLLDKGM